MKYPKNKIVQNLQTAVNVGDHDMVMDLLNDQITDIALSHAEALNAALKNAGVSVTSSTDPKYLVGLVADNWNNNKLIQNISLIIADLNTPNQNQHVNSGGADFISGIAGAIGDVTTAAASITTAALAPKVEKEKNKGKMFDMLTAKQGAKGAIAGAEAQVKIEAQKQKSTLVYAGVILAVVIIGAVAMVVIQSSRSTAPAV